jgi:hypothetical protein
MVIKFFLSPFDNGVVLDGNQILFGHHPIHPHYPMVIKFFGRPKMHGGKAMK